MQIEKHTCRRCNCSWDACSLSDLKWWRNFSEQKGGVIPQQNLILWLKENTELTEYDIKNIVGNMVFEIGVCHNCGKSLGKSNSIKIDCKKCGSLNYNI